MHVKVNSFGSFTKARFRYRTCYTLEGFCVNNSLGFEQSSDKQSVKSFRPHNHSRNIPRISVDVNIHGRLESWLIYLNSTFSKNLVLCCCCCCCWSSTGVNVTPGRSKKPNFTKRIEDRVRRVPPDDKQQLVTVKISQALKKDFSIFSLLTTWIFIYYYFYFFTAVREDRAPGGRPRIKSLIGMKENAETFVSSELITQLIQARPDAVPKRRFVGSCLQQFTITRTRPVTTVLSTTLNSLHFAASGGVVSKFVGLSWHRYSP